jgi:tetratricopeptide (TPR) repeat protein
VETPFWSRPFRDRTIVINPDRAALIHWTKASYSPRDSQSEPPPDQVVQHGGELVHQFTGIHYAFEPFPAELKTSNKGSIYKTGLSLVDAGAPFSVLSSLNAMMMSGDEANALTIVQRHATLEPEQFVYVRLLSSLMDTEEFLAFVRPGLDARPLRVEWHRAYQEAVETSGAQTDLAAEYDARLAADPADANLIYLAGRARQDPEEAETYFRRAADATPPSPWALSALNYDLMSEGRFEEALDFGRRAAALDPANLGFQSLLYDALLANGLYPEAIEQARTLRLLMTGRQDRTWVNLELIPQVLSGDEAAVNGLLARTTDWVSSLGGDAADQAHMRRGLEGDVAYIQGRPDEALEKWKDLDDYRFEVAVTSGQFAAALALLQENEENLDSSDHLLAYLLAQRAGDDAAVRHRERAAESLAQGNADQRRFAAALRDPASADLPALMKVPLKDSDKLLALTALGVASPLARPTLYPLARKLDYRPDFPHLFIRSWLDALPAE